MEYRPGDIVVVVRVDPPEYCTRRWRHPLIDRTGRIAEIRGTAISWPYKVDQVAINGRLWAGPGSMDMWVHQVRWPTEAELVEYHLEHPGATL